MATISERIADFAQSPEVRGDDALSKGMRLYALDTLAVMLAGSIAPSSNSMLRTIAAACGKAEATIAGEGIMTSAWDAALVNGTYAHALELDDDHRIAVLHPGAVVIPAALAVAESERASGPVFLRSLLVGYEVMCRLGEVFKGSQFHHGMHPTALCGVFGAASAAAVAMDLDRDAFINALGIAGTQSFGLTEWSADGSWIKRFHPGRAAQSGILAARLAREGFTGPATIFEGKSGFLRVFSFGEETEVECLTKNLGKEFHAYGTAIKPYPCCRFEHGALDLAIQAHREGLKPDMIESVQLRIYDTGLLTYHQVPKNAVDAQFNLPYGVAVALLHGNVRLRDFTDQAIRAPEVLALCRKVTVVEDSEYSAHYPAEYWVELTIRCADGSTRRFFSDCPSGDPAAASYVDDPGKLGREVENKIAALLNECGFGYRTEDLANAVHALPEAQNLDLLCTIIGSGRTAEAAHNRVAR